jgi:hypothetical protein
MEEPEDEADRGAGSESAYRTVTAFDEDHPPRTLL